MNEAGASVYSTSPIGREELPKYDATVRGAVSIGRRLLDPLSELVKINPANIGKASHEKDAETTPLRNPEHYQYDFNIGEITELWRRGSVVASWLLDLTAQSFVTSPDLSNFSGKVSDSGEGRWTVAAANDEGVPAHVLTASLFERFASRGQDDFQNRVLSAMRFGFGGHVEKK